MEDVAELRAITRSRQSQYHKHLAKYKLKTIAAGEPSLERDRARLALVEIRLHANITPECAVLIGELVRSSGAGNLENVDTDIIDEFCGRHNWDKPARLLFCVWKGLQNGE
jgi:hypothetical protein